MEDGCSKRFDIGTSGISVDHIGTNHNGTNLISTSCIDIHTA